MSPFENTENDELVADLAPRYDSLISSLLSQTCRTAMSRLYFTPLPTMFQSGGRNQPIASTVLEEGENPTILALKPTRVPLN